MRRLRKFFDLSRAERWLLTRALVVVGCVRVGLWLLPFRVLRPLIARLTRAQSEPPTVHEPSIDRVAWAVSAAAQRVPRATCLTQALAMQALLARCGEMSELHIGVARDERQGILAHAWVESRGRVIIGGESLERYIPVLPPWTVNEVVMTSGRPRCMERTRGDVETGGSAGFAGRGHREIVAPFLGEKELHRRPVGQNA